MKQFIAATFLVLVAWLSGQHRPTKLASAGTVVFWGGGFVLSGIVCTIADSNLPVLKIEGFGLLIIGLASATIYLIAAATKAYSIAYRR